MLGDLPYEVVVPNTSPNTMSIQNHLKWQALIQFTNVVKSFCVIWRCKIANKDRSPLNSSTRGLRWEGQFSVTGKVWKCIESPTLALLPPASASVCFWCLVATCTAYPSKDEAKLSISSFINFQLSLFIQLVRRNPDEAWPLRLWYSIFEASRFLCFYSSGLLYSEKFAKFNGRVASLRVWKWPSTYHKASLRALINGSPCLPPSPFHVIPVSRR